MITNKVIAIDFDGTITKENIFPKIGEFRPNVKEALEVMEQYFPAERKQCEDIWKSVYSEYRRIDYRIRVKENRRLCQ